MEAAALSGLVDLEAGVAEDVDHRVVLVEHLGLEPGEPGARGDPGQALEEQRADAPALVGVVDEEGHLGAAADPHGGVAAHADDPRVLPLPDDREQAEAVARLPRAHELDHAAGDVGDRAHESHLERLARDRAHEGLDGRDVLGPGAPQEDGLPVAQKDVLAVLAPLGDDPEHGTSFDTRFVRTSTGARASRGGRAA